MILRIEIPENEISFNHCSTICRYLGHTFSGQGINKCVLFDQLLFVDQNLPTHLSQATHFFRCEKCHSREEIWI